MPSASIFTTGAMPLASFMLLEGQCATPVPCAFRILHVGRVQPDAVRDDGPAIQNAQRFQQPRGRHVARAQRVVIFDLGFGEMHHQRRVEFVGQLARGLEIGVVVGIDGVRGDGGNDQRDRPGIARETSR